MRQGKRFFLDLEERLVAGFVKVKDKETNNDYSCLTFNGLMSFIGKLEPCLFEGHPNLKIS